MSTFKVFIFHDVHVDMYFSEPWERAWRATARLQDQCERERERRWFKLNALAARTATYYGESDDRVTRQATSDRQQDLNVTTLASGTCLAWPLIHSRDPLLADCLTVKLSPCKYSHSSPAGRIAACLCGHPKYNLLLAQAHPRMIQHLSSYYTHVHVTACDKVMYMSHVGYCCVHELWACEQVNFELSLYNHVVNLETSVCCQTSYCH